MNRLALALLALSAAPVLAEPVHVAMKAGASVVPDAAGFLPLAGVADLTGGGDALRARLARIEVGRAPMPGDVRHLTRGDLALKMRQAGFEPGRDALLEGAESADVTVGAAEAPGLPPPPPAPGQGGGGGGILIRRGDTVTIRIDDSDISITAKGVARDGGAAGDLIHVHRDGCMADLTVTVLDTQTVLLEP